MSEFQRCYKFAGAGVGISGDDSRGRGIRGEAEVLSMRLILTTNVGSLLLFCQKDRLH